MTNFHPLLRPLSSRRQFLRTSGLAAAAGAALGVTPFKSLAAAVGVKANASSAQLFEVGRQAGQNLAAWCTSNGIASSSVRLDLLINATEAFRSIQNGFFFGLQSSSLGATGMLVSQIEHSQSGHSQNLLGAVTATNIENGKSLCIEFEPVLLSFETLGILPGQRNHCDAVVCDAVRYYPIERLSA